MKVLMCNSYFYLRGGVERCFFDLLDLLTAHGHEVIPFCMEHPRNQPSAYARYFVSEIDYPSLAQRKTSLATKLRVLERVVYSGEAQRKIEELIVDTRPDIAHVQEVDHEISASILPVIKRHGIPIVQTLHDYKLLCPNTNFISRGQICERCAGGKFYHAVLRRCKRDALLASLLAALETYFLHVSKIYQKNVDTFVVPGRFLQQKLADNGLGAEMMRLPHFVDLDRFQPVYEATDYFIYFGRLVELKGVKTLFEALRYIDPSLQVYIAGEGELEESLQAYASQHGMENVRFWGYLPTEELIPLVQRAAFTVFPSECYENYPMTLIESLACGTPVVGSNIGGIPDIVQDGQSGLLFEPGDARQLAEKIEYLADRPEQAARMGRNGRRQVETLNDPERYYQQIVQLYQALMVSNTEERSEMQLIRKGMV
jgi:glycosyltransferase involved in cell wall biosynthesis